MRTIRLFVSSPGDVEYERLRVDQVSQRLNGEFAHAARIDPIRWETGFYQAYDTYQAQIPEAATCDLVLGIFWSRLGSELPAEFQRLPDGQPYPSGSAYEVLTAIEARRKGEQPDVYIFRKTAPPLVALDDLPKLMTAQSQWSRLEEFFQHWFLTPQGTFRAAYQTFETTDEFEREIEKLLRAWLSERILHDGGPSVWPIEIKGSPFRGLDAFDTHHSAVFFGRSRDITRATERLLAAAGKGTPFLLLLGPSGAGKSSLARAGLVPRITRPGVVPAVGVWRLATMRPGGAGEPVDALAEALFAGAKSGAGGGDSPAALPEIAEGDYKTPKELAALMRAGPDAATVPVVRALDRIGAEARRQGGFDRDVRADLLLVIDQLDDLFSARVDATARAMFAKALAALARTGRVWVITTLRADLYEHLLGEPDLVALKGKGADYDLSPPDEADLAEIVRKPAEIAGLVYETDPKTGESLDERILREAGTADTLPLLQFTLQRLFEERTVAGGKTMLTIAAYQSFGGIEGALREEGDQALKKAGLGEHTELVLARLVRALTAYDRERQVLTQQPARWESAVVDAESQRLVEALLERRILIASDDDLTDGNRGTLHLAHEAVLRAWPAFRRHLESAKLYRRVLAECSGQMPGWKAKRCEPFWRRSGADDELLRGIELAEARRVRRLFGNELDADARDFIDASDRLDRRRSMFAVVIAAWAVAMAAFAVWGWIQSTKVQTTSARNYRIAAKQVVDSITDEIRSQRSNLARMPPEAIRHVLDTYGRAIGQLVGTAADDPFLKHSQEMMLREFAQAFEAAGQTEAAREAYERSRVIADDLARRDPGNMDWQEDLKFIEERLRTLGK